MYPVFCTISSDDEILRDEDDLHLSEKEEEFNDSSIYHESKTRTFVSNGSRYEIKLLSESRESSVPKELLGKLTTKIDVSVPANNRGSDVILSRTGLDTLTRLTGKDATKLADCGIIIDLSLSLIHI